VRRPPGYRRAFRLDRHARSDARAAVDEELAHHLELCVEELVARGWDVDDARREAARRFGDVNGTRAYCEDVQARRGREERRSMSLDELRQDLRYALRSIRRAPGYSALVVATIAFGIAANTTTFSVINPYLFRPLPYGDADRLVQVNQVNPVTGWDMDRFSYPQYLDWKERARAFDDVAAYVYGSANVTGPEGPEQVQYSTVTANLFDVLDAPAVLGRTFRSEEGGAGATPVSVLAHGFWERRYGADPSVVGRTITLDGVQHTVIGVMPSDFVFPFGSARLWVPVRDDASADRGRLPYQLVGRLAKGWDAERAHGELSAIQTELAALHPETDARMDGVTVKPLREALNFAWEVVSVLFLTLLGGVGFVLLIACVNVASLTLARCSGRLREISLRAALGAGRARIVRQLLTESLVLAAVAGALGIAVSYWLARVLNPLVPEDLYRVGAIDIDGTVLAFSVVVTLLTPVGFALLPALGASRTDLARALQEGARGSGGRAASRGRRALVVTQVALAVVLTSGAGLMLRSFRVVQGLDLGFDAERVATAEVVLPAEAYPTSGERRALMADAVRAAAGLPGVVSASAVTWLPLNHETITTQIAPAELAGTPAEEWPLAVRNLVHPGYFGTMGIGVLSGRGFEELDGEDGRPVVVVSRSLADRFWPSGTAVDRTLLAGDPAEPRALLVVGVVDDVRHTDLNEGDRGPQLYEPALQAGARRFFLVARTPGEPADLIPELRSALGAVAPDLPIALRPLSDVVAENHLQWSVTSVFLAIFGAGALLLATLGIYGLISYSVAQRNREIGVRIALGASAEEIRRSVVGDGVRLAGVGLAIGLVAALGLARVASAALYGVRPSDPATLGSVVAIFLGVAAVASLIPAARASRTSPSEVLRGD
jgi:predicted permease